LVGVKIVDDSYWRAGQGRADAVNGNASVVTIQDVIAELNLI
jgi:hypothetical protein